MAKKAIAAMLLLVVAAWAEMALAPMLLMRAGHMLPGHTMAGAGAEQDTRQTQAHHHAQQAQAAALPCCPELHKREPGAALVWIAGAPNCDDSHSCCYRRGPQSVPAPVRDVQRLGRELAPAAAMKVNLPVESETKVAGSSLLGFRPSADAFGMTLRI
jgi:hypothetical protein